MTDLYNETYRPKNLTEFIGNRNAITITKSFIKSFPEHKVLLYIGPPGTGKTTFALLLPELTDTPYSHFNASLMRKQDITNFGDNILTQSLFCKRNIFILDEVDKFTKPQQKQLAKLVKNSNQPVIMIANYKEKLSKLLTNMAIIVYFESPTTDQIKERLLQISNDTELVNQISDKADTIRSALNMLESGLQYDTEDEILSNWDALQSQVERGIAQHQKMSNSEIIVYLNDSNANPKLLSMMDYYDGLSRRGGRLSSIAVKELLKHIRVKKLTSFPRTWMLMSKYKPKVPVARQEDKYL